MKFFAFALIFALFVGIFADETEYFYRNPKYPGKCVYRDVIVSVGEQGQPRGFCELFTCGKGLTGEIESCDDPEVDPPCHLGGLTNPNGAFPDCCEKHVICP